MKRREVIRKIAYTVPAGMAFPHLFGCTTNDDDGDSAFTGKIIVIGAGAAGMYMAFLLNQKGMNVEILEASSRNGGRIQYLQGFSDFPLELGADEIYGNNHIWHELITGMGITVIERAPRPVYVLDGVPGTAEDYQNDTDFQVAQGFINEIPNYQGPDITIQNAITSAGIKNRVHHIMNAEIGNQYGTSNDRLSIRGASSQQNNFEGGSGIYVVQGQSHITILNSVFASIRDKIKHNTPVSSIDYTGALVEIRDTNGEVHSAEKVIITVPISILKDGDISFTPTLSGSKLNAIQNLGMDAGMKVAIAFNANFWGADTTSIISDGVVPRYYAPGLGRSNSNSVLTAYIMGEQAEFLNNFEDNQIYESLLAELDKLYHGNASRLVARDKEENIQGVVKNWTKEPYIKGAYSYPKVGSSLAREILALPVDNRLFFAGEATGLKGDFGTVQGALTSAERVLEEIVEAIAKDLAPF